MNSTINDILDFKPQLVRANTGKRFANYLIDLAAFLLLLMLFFIVLFFLSPESFDKIVDDESASSDFIQRIVLNILFAIFIALTELATKGRSLGKLITGTKAVKNDGTNITASTAFKRGLVRIVPLEPFSALSVICNPWHDRWTKTMVIDIKASNIIQTPIDSNPVNSTFI